MRKRRNGKTSKRRNEEGAKRRSDGATKAGMVMKTCWRCGESKPLEAFSKGRGQCKGCNSESYAKRKEEDPVGFAERNRKYSAKSYAKRKEEDPVGFAERRRKINAKSDAKRKEEDPVGLAERKRKIDAKKRAKKGVLPRQEPLACWKECGRCGAYRWVWARHWRAVNFCGGCWFGHSKECMEIKKLFRRQTDGDQDQGEEK